MISHTKLRNADRIGSSFGQDLVSLCVCVYARVLVLSIYLYSVVVCSFPVH